MPSNKTEIKTPTLVILAGGVGKRFAPLTINKAMVPMMGKALILHTLEQVAAAGFKQAIVITNSQNQDLITHYRSSMQITALLQTMPLGMADALLLAKSHITGPMLVMNASDFVDDQLLMDLLQKTKLNQVMTVGKQMSRYFDGGYLEVDGERVLSVIEKPGDGNQPSDLVKLVFDYFPNCQSFFELLEKTPSDQDDVYEKSLAQLMKTESVIYHKYLGNWQALKYPHMLLNVLDFLLQKNTKAVISKSARIHPSAVIDGPVVIADNVKIEAGAIIKGPCYIGAQTIVGNHALVRESVIEKNCLIGFGSEVARSYIGPCCKLHHNFVGDSVLESNVNPSYGSTLANWRFDGQTINLKYGDKKINSGRVKLGAILADSVFCGVNCSLMPGTTVGTQTQIYPNCVIKGQVGDNQIIKKSNT